MSSTVSWVARMLDKVLEEEKGLSPEGRERISGLIGELKNPKMFLIEWGEEDIQQTARKRIAWNLDVEKEQIIENPLSEEEVIEVIRLLEKTHDCNYGMTWDHIDCALDSIGFSAITENYLIEK